METPEACPERFAIVIDDYEALRESHAQTLRGAGYIARGLSFEAAMLLSDSELTVLDLAVVDLHDARSDAERTKEADNAGLTGKLPWHDRLAGWRFLVRLEDLAVTNDRMPRVVVASAVMQIEPDLTERAFELKVVSGAFSTIGVASEAAWLEQVSNATSSRPVSTAKYRWGDAIPRWHTYRALVRSVDRYPSAVRYVLEKGGRLSRPEERELDRLNARAGAASSHRGALRLVLRKVLGWDVPHA